MIPNGAKFLFVAELSGGPDNEKSFYCKGWSYSWGDGTITATSPSCVMYKPDVEIPRHFQMSYSYEEPGVYEAVFKYGHLTSNTVEVVVESVDPQAATTPAPFGTSSVETPPAEMVFAALGVPDAKNLGGWVLSVG